MQKNKYLIKKKKVFFFIGPNYVNLQEDMD